MAKLPWLASDTDSRLLARLSAAVEWVLQTHGSDVGRSKCRKSSPGSPSPEILTEKKEK